MSKVAEQAVEEALGRCAAGDRSAFAEIVRVHQSMVYSVALNFLRNPSLAEDLAQEVFLDLYRSLGSIKSGAHLRHWLRKVTCHRSIDRVRRGHGDGMVSLDDIPEPAAAKRARDPLLEEKLWSLVSSLPDKARMVLVLRYQEEMELREIAEVLEMPINSVKSSMDRALDLLRTKLSHTLGGVKV